MSVFHGIIYFSTEEEKILNLERERGIHFKASVGFAYNGDVESVTDRCVAGGGNFDSKVKTLAHIGLVGKKRFYPERICSFCGFVCAAGV